jgi:ubiquinone biosynthesis monooxygenase Coq7
MHNRGYSKVDEFVINLDQAIRTLFGKPITTERCNPGRDVDEGELDTAEKDQIVRLMRINHTGEVCAQALYQGQSLTARDPATRASMERSAAEENDHLDWCETRVHELGGRLSLLNPLWYAGSFCIGAAAGLAGDKWSLGFVAETEKQVEGHLEEHLAQLPPSDSRSRIILEQMKKDEIRHGEKARAYGGAELPKPLKAAMTFASKVMTKTVYWI